VPSTGGSGVPTAPPPAGAVPASPQGQLGTPQEEAEATQPAPATASAPVSASGSSPSPWAPIGVGLAATALAIGLPWWLGRRFAW
jgi:hypothetical protein